MLGLINSLMIKKLLAIIIAPPVISINLSPIDNIISDHLQTGSIRSISHNKGPNIFRMVGKFGFVDFDGFAVVTEFVALVVVLEVDVD